MKIQIHQICYSKETLANIPEGFLALDNLNNERPDWREYWPIRNYLLRNELKDDVLYGFFSPKFNAKTGLTIKEIESFVTKNYNNHACVSFSPFWDLSSIFINIFEQGDFFHPGLKDAMKEFASIHLDSFELCDTITHSQNNIFCNYFLATNKFWKEWLLIGEKLFNVAESNATILAEKMNSNTTYGQQEIPLKIFMQERLATTCLLLNPELKNLSYSPFEIGASTTPFNQFWSESINSDALKICYEKTKNMIYISEFNHVRNNIIGKL